MNEEEEEIKIKNFHKVYTEFIEYFVFHLHSTSRCPDVLIVLSIQEYESGSRKNLHRDDFAFLAVASLNKEIVCSTRQNLLDMKCHGS